MNNYIIQDGGRELYVTRDQVRHFLNQVVAKGGTVQRRASFKSHGRTTGMHGQRRASYLLAKLGKGESAIFRSI